MKLIMTILGFAFGVFTQTSAVGSTANIESFEGCIRKYNSTFRMTVQRHDQESEDRFQTALLGLSQEFEGAGFKIHYLDIKSGTFLLQTLDPVLAEKYATEQIANGSLIFRDCQVEGVFQ